MLEKEVIIINKLGLHARAAAKLVKTASAFGSQVTLDKAGQQVNGKSIMGVMMLAASKGTVLQIQTDGEGEEEAMRALVTLIDDKFGEDS